MSDLLDTGRPPSGSAARGFTAKTAAIFGRLVDVVTDRQALESGRLPKQLKDFVHGGHSMLAGAAREATSPRPIINLRLRGTCSNEICSTMI